MNKTLRRVRLEWVAGDHSVLCFLSRDNPSTNSNEHRSVIQFMFEVIVDAGDGADGANGNADRTSGLSRNCQVNSRQRSAPARE